MLLKRIEQVKNSKFLRKVKDIQEYLCNLRIVNIVNKKTEILLMVLSILLIGLLVVSQIGLFNKSTRTFFTNIDQYEGIDVETMNSTFEYGKLSLQLIDCPPNDNIKILLNGVEMYTFNSELVDIEVKNNCVVEIDGTKQESPFKVEVVSVSDNVATQCLGKRIDVESNIKILSRIFLK